MADVSRVSMNPGATALTAIPPRTPRPEAHDADDAGLEAAWFVCPTFPAMPATDDRQTMRPPSWAPLGEAPR
jgi:hypothetical protein